MDKSLNLIALPFSFKYDRPIESIKKIQAEWHNLISGYQIDKDGLELIEFMSEEIAKDTSNSIEYFKIANFIFYLLRINPKTKDVDGVIYPSVKVGGEGFNLVLKPEVVDNNRLVLQDGSVNIPKVIGKVREFVNSLDELKGVITTSEVDYDGKYQIIIEIDKK